ncbi:MAG: fatty acid desaturase [Ascidiaceihabitans sp.]|jgi:fatty acid desaturase
MAQEPTPNGIVWHDLRSFSRWDLLRELTLPLPWIALSFYIYSTDMWMFGPIASFMFFLCGLRLNHEAIHGNLGLSRRGDSVVMTTLSAIMLGSNHADAYCHVRHHKFNMGDGDIEGRCGRMGFWEVLRYGPRFPVDLNLAAWRSGSRYWRKRVVIDWLAIFVFVAICLISGQQFLILHLGAMVVAQCLTALFAVWITHQGTENSDLAGRSQRGVFAIAAYLMFYHREHHLFPRVPVNKLPKLAARLDAQIPGYAETRKPVVPWLDRTRA